MRDVVAYISVRALFAALGCLSQGSRVAIFAALWRVAFCVVPRLRHTAEVNLEIAFPDKDAKWRKDLLRKNAQEMGRLLADTIRLSSLDATWVREHVQIPALERYRECAQAGGVLIATGHLGSFELLGHAIGLLGCPLAAVARRFKSPRMDRWWTGLREARGNRIIDRAGAFREITKSISSGTSVAVLFDQNVKSNHAVFVDWFGTSAATTRAFALAAIKTRSTVFVASIRYCDNDRYQVDAVECDFAEIYSDDSMDDSSKVKRITQVISDHYCGMIREFPEGWFWIHRRWKTRPTEDNRRIYA